ncbi:MAG: SBBP repeat-containing protein [Candidatus Solibacter sp.]
MLRPLLLLLPLALSAFPLRFEASPSGDSFTVRHAVLRRHAVEFAGGTRMTLPGGSMHMPVAGAAAGSVSYLERRDPSKWRLHVPQYACVMYREVYPGIDLVFHDASGRLEYDFRLQPGADPSAIRVRFDSLDGVRLEGGELVAGSLRQHRPVAFQDTPDGRRVVAVRYRLRGTEVTFSLDAYDRSLPLVIDPVLSYATYADASGAEVGSSVAVDSTGNAFLAGTTDSANFPPKPAGTAARGFVGKLDAAGANFTSMVVIAGASIDGMALDSAGNPVVTGSVSDLAQFPGATPAGYQAGTSGGFIARFTQDATGFKLAFIATFAASPGAIALDPKDFIYVTGAAGPSFRTTAGVVQGAPSGGIGDAFALKLSADGARAVYATFVGGSREDAARAIAVDSGGEAYITGDTASANFPVTPGSLQPAFGGRVIDPFTGAVFGDAFVAKLDAGAASLVFSTYLGGKAPDVAYGIALDKDNNAYVTGSTQSADFATTQGALQTKYAGGTPVTEAADPAGDSFLVKLTANGVRLWSTFLGGSARDIAEAVTVDSSGDAIVTGATDSPDFPFTVGALAGCRTGGPWLASVDSAGAKLLASTSLPGSGLEEPHALARDPQGEFYIAGDATSRAFLSTPGAAQTAYGGGDTDAFVAKVDLGAPSRMAVSCVLNAASFQPGNFNPFPLFTVAPGEIISLFGAGLGPEQGAVGQPAGGVFPKTLAGTQVLFDGVAAPLLYAGSNQINAIVPYGVKSPATQMTLQRGGISDGPCPLPVAAAVPGFSRRTPPASGKRRC